MPSPQTVIAVTLIGSILGGVAAALFIFDWVRKRAKSVREGGMSPVLRWPKVTLALVLFAIFCSAVGLWLLFHLPKPVPPPPCPAVKEGPICPAPSGHSTVDKNLSPKPPKTGATTATQGGHDNQQTTIGGNVKQGGNGDCQQNVIGGNGNTNLCTPVMPKISEAQEKKINISLAKIPNFEGALSIYYDFTAEGGENLAQRIEAAFQGTKVKLIDKPTVNFTIDGPSYPGLSLGNVSEENNVLADAIDKILSKNGIISKPLKRVKASPRSSDKSLWVIIRKP